MSDWGTLPPSSSIKPNPIDEFLKKAIVRNVKGDVTGVKIWKRRGMSKQALCEGVGSLLP